MPDYFVQSSISADDTATFQDRESGEQDVSVTVTQDRDGSPDALRPLTLTIDLNVDARADVVVNINGHPYIEMSTD